jgi:hypothetical protein
MIVKGIQKSKRFVMLSRSEASLVREKRDALLRLSMTAPFQVNNILSIALGDREAHKHTPSGSASVCTVAARNSLTRSTVRIHS